MHTDRHWLVISLFTFKSDFPVDCMSRKGWWGAQTVWTSWLVSKPRGPTINTHTHTLTHTQMWQHQGKRGNRTVEWLMYFLGGKRERKRKRQREREMPPCVDPFWFMYFQASNIRDYPDSFYVVQYLWVLFRSFSVNLKLQNEVQVVLLWYQEKWRSIFYCNWHLLTVFSYWGGFLDSLFVAVWL